MVKGLNQNFCRKRNRLGQHIETSIAYIKRKLGNNDLFLHAKKVTIGKKNIFRNIVKISLNFQLKNRNILILNCD